MRPAGGARASDLRDDGAVRMGRLVPDDEAGRALAIDVLRAGGIVGLPTDTVYGIAVAFDTAGGLERLFAVKDRPPQRAIMVLVDSIDQVAELVEVPAEARVLAAAFWPGGLTLVLPVRPGVTLPAALSAGMPTLGVRVPDHPTARAIIRALGAPVTGTSANLSGRPSARTAAEAHAQLGDLVDLIVDGGPCPGGIESTVIDVTVVPPMVLREGAVTMQQLRQICPEVASSVDNSGPGC